jgi:D-sedoheptulose 7-phosphate isomerase
MEDEDVARLFDRRAAPVQDLADHAGTVAAACHAMAVRFHQGGKLVVFGTGAASTDALHVAVEFVHPVIVGKRALPAISLTADAATVTGLAARDGMGGIFAHQIRYLAGPADIALGISANGADESVLNGLVTAHEMGMLTIALVGGDGAGVGGDGGDREDGAGVGGDGGAIGASPAVDHLFAARSSDPRIVKEVHVTSYHLLWELVHVFFEQPGVLDPEVVR